MIPYELKAHLCRSCTFFKKDDPAVPAELFSVKNAAPELAGFPYPLPSRKCDYTCCIEADDAVWMGAKTGLTRYDKNAEREEDIIMYFSADRDLNDNNVCALLAKDGGVWVLTDTGVVFIKMVMMGAEEKANILLKETLDFVDRRGMVSQRHLAEPRIRESRYPYDHSDNDGGFTACYAVGEIFRYATFKKEKGADHPDTLDAKKTATRAVEACLLLMHIHGRGDGFVARSYSLSDEVVPDDGLFFKKQNGKAICIETTASKRRGCAGAVIDADAPIPERLARLYTDLGYTDNDITYKADTSSDEITLHYLCMLFAHRYLACDDPELDELIKISLTGILDHIIDHGYELHDFTGKPTTWAKWSIPYFLTEDGWVDACLNTAEVLSYHLVNLEVAGENEKWRKSYDYLINELHYADLIPMHFDRLFQSSLVENCDIRYPIMYGDHMLAVTSLWMLCTLETDEELLKKYRDGFRSWQSSIAVEHNPGYDFPFALSCPGEEIDMEEIATWFYRMNSSRVASSVSAKGRHDVPYHPLKGGYKAMSTLLPNDERFISKYDRDPIEYKNEDSGGARCIESCYPYTYAYWIGRFFGFIK